MPYSPDLALYPSFPTIPLHSSTIMTSSIYDYWLSIVRSLLSSLGFKGKEGTLLLLGLDNAGKTTLLHRLRTGQIRNYPPTD